MTRKDYEAFAAMLVSHSYVADNPVQGSEIGAGYEDARLDIGRSIAAILKLDNPRFDAVKFYEAAKL